MTDERLIFDGHGVPRPNPAFPQKPLEGAAEQFRDENFDNRVVAYLLGQLSEQEAEQFEDECLAQECWPPQIEAVEDDLIDEYLHGELSREQHQSFELNYLTTEARQARVRTAAALLRHVCEPDPVSVAPVVVVSNGKTWTEQIRACWESRSWQLRAACAVTALVIVVGGASLYRVSVRPPRVVATLNLTSSVGNRSEGPQARTIKLPPDAGALRVSLMLPNNAAPGLRYRVELDSEDGETTPLAVAGQDDKSVAVVIPVSKLARGQYALTLFAFKDDGTQQPVYGTYTFSVE
jgi:hypothetical protein